MKLIESFLDLLFPPKCPFCGKLTETPGICPDCQKILPWVADGDIVWELPGGVRCAAPLWYEGTVRDALLRFKFHGASALARPLGELMAQCAAEHFSGEFDTLTWVPVSRRRLRQRGYDQSELLARSAGAVWGVRPERLLVKHADNPAQSGLESAAARAENVRDVYRAQHTAGKRVLLVDDIFTTGATLSACVQALRQAGAAAVVCVTAARTPLETDREKVHSSVKE